jgi:hypothetical protein
MKSINLLLSALTILGVASSASASVTLSGEVPAGYRVFARVSYQSTDSSLSCTSYSMSDFRRVPKLFNSEMPARTQGSNFLLVIPTELAQCHAKLWSAPELRMQAPGTDDPTAAHLYGGTIGLQAVGQDIQTEQVVQCGIVDHGNGRFTTCHGNVGVGPSGTAKIRVEQN